MKLKLIGPHLTPEQQNDLSRHDQRETAREVALNRRTPLPIAVITTALPGLAIGIYVLVKFFGA